MAEPWIKFYPDVWNGDLELASCSLASQGFFARLISVLHRSYPYGYLCDNCTITALSRGLGVHHKTCIKCLKELEESGVLKRDKFGLYSKRMRLEWEKRQQAISDGKRGGNPNILNPTLNPKVNPHLNDTVNLDIEVDIDTKEEVSPKPEPSDVSLFPDDSTPMRLAVHLRKCIKGNNPKAKTPTSLQKWAADIDKMIRIDKLEPDDIVAVIDWCQDDDFWRANILSGYKLRKKWDTLYLQSKAHKGNANKQAEEAIPLDENGNPLARVGDEFMPQGEFNKLIKSGEIVHGKGGWKRKGE